MRKPIGEAPRHVFSDGMLHEVTTLLRQHDVVSAALFGSFARGEASEESDIDLLVEFRGEKSLLDLVALKLALEEMLGRGVHVLTRNALYPAIRQRILDERVTIL